MNQNLKEEVLSLANNGVIKTSQLSNAGIRRGILSELVNNGELTMYDRGLYVLPEVWEDEFYLLQQKYKRCIFSHATALYLWGYSQRVPLSFHVTFPSNYHCESLNKENVIVTRVLKDKYAIGLTTINSPLGNEILVYNLERTLCDIVKGAGDDIQIVKYAMKKYALSKDKDLNKLMKYAKIFRVEPKIRKYMEVLL